MREDPLSRDSMFDGLRYSDGNEQQIGTWRRNVWGYGGNHVKKQIFDFRTERYRRGDVLCFFNFLLELGCGRFWG